MEIYAEISRSMINKIRSGKTTLSFPVDINVNNRRNSRAFFLSCDDSMNEELISFLDQHNINWQEN